MMKKIKIKLKSIFCLSKNWYIYIYSILLSIVLYTQSLIIKGNNKLGFITSGNVFKTIVLFLILTVILYLFFYFLITKINCINFKKCNYDKKSLIKIFFISNFFMICLWLLCFVTFYPGGGFYDTYLQIRAPIYATTQHPLGYNLLLYLFVVILGNGMFHSSIIGWALYSIFQIFIVSISISFAIVFIAKRNAPSKFIISLLVLIYSLTPVYATFSIFATKDVLFSVLIIYLTLLLILVLESEGQIIKQNKFKIFYILIGVLLFQIRINGNIIYVLLTIILICKYHKYFSRFFYVLLLIPISIYVSMNFFISSHFGVEHLFQETVGVPIQQLSATVYTNGNLTDKEINYINKLLDIEIIKQQYNPALVNNIKWNKDFHNEYLQNNKIEFFKTWFSVMLKNFKVYVESYLLETYYFWSINPFSNESNMYLDTQSDTQDGFIDEVKNTYNIKTNDILPEKVQNKLESFYTKFSNYFSEGTCFWILIFLCLILLHKNQKNHIIIYIPLIIIWLTIMLSAPINSSLRYMYPYVLLLPILIVYTLTIKEK